MKKELKYIVLNYTEDDSEYINYLIQELDKICEEIVNFFDIEEFGKKVNVTLNNNMETFEEKYKKTGYPLEDDGTFPNWICGFSYRKNVETLCLREYRNTANRSEVNVQDLLHLILHEFTHACHEKVMRNPNKSYMWLSEGLATTLSHQHDNDDDVFTASLEDMMFGLADYKNYHIMFKYVLETHGRDFVLKLIHSYKALEEYTPMLYYEVSQVYKKNKSR